MIIVVSASGKTLDAQVDLRFGRAAFFVAVDSESDVFQAHENSQNLNAAQGAGIQAVQTLAKLGVQAVVTGHVGPKAWTALQAAKISVYAACEGTVEQVMKAFMAKQLQPVASHNVQGHW